MFILLHDIRNRIVLVVAVRLFLIISNDLGFTISFSMKFHAFIAMFEKKKGLCPLQASFPIHRLRFLGFS